MYTYVLTFVHWLLILAMSLCFDWSRDVVMNSV
jgi:Domain of unknown function (DUF1736)